MYQEPESAPYNGTKPWWYSLECGGRSTKTSYANGECGAAFLAKGPQKCWDSGGHWQRGRESGGAPIQTPPDLADLVEFGGASGIGRGKPSDPSKSSYGNGELQLQFRERGPQTGGITLAVEILGPKARSPDIHDWVKHCVRGHAQCTRQHRSTDVKVWDNTTTRTLSFGKETADQAIQQGNAQEIADDRVKGRTFSGVQHEGQQYITKYNSRRSTLETITTGNWVPNEDTNCWNQEPDPERLATVTGNAGRHSVKRSLNLLESTASLRLWEGIHGASTQQGVNWTSNHRNPWRRQESTASSANPLPTGK
ncbi:hypothetical protein R3P38DRAFT_2809429 [Favolaschia claudopus]|uniref:Uncharacterized protein n=1 Tax=Favolaschia claudopus TaxID=2862362 RepID=A0AAV9ZDN6_9AGAR